MPRLSILGIDIDRIPISYLYPRGYILSVVRPTTTIRLFLFSYTNIVSVSISSSYLAYLVILTIVYSVFRLEAKLIVSRLVSIGDRYYKIKSLILDALITKLINIGILVLAF